MRQEDILDTGIPQERIGKDTNMVAISTRSRMYARIMDAMPDDKEVQEFCAKEIERNDKVAKKTADKLEMALETIKGHAAVAVGTKDFAREVNLKFNPETRWGARTASYYLRKLVEQGRVEEIVPEKKSESKKYLYIG